MGKEMKEITAKINKTRAGSLRRQPKLTNLQPNSSIKKETRIKSTKLEMKRRGYNRQCINTKDYKRLLQTTIWQ